MPMTRLLYVEASPRKADAASIVAADLFFDAFAHARPDVEIDRLDLWNTDLPDFDGALITAKYARLAGKAMDSDLAAAWEVLGALVDRFTSADAIVIATPLWNFGIPYKLKHWIDLITQPGLTFTFDPATGYAPVVASRPTLVIVASAGDYGTGHSYGRPDLATPYLETALAFLGIEDVAVEHVGPTAGPTETVNAARARAARRLQGRAATFLELAA
jgi:FMN-dependent NADH-azoreductase